LIETTINTSSCLPPPHAGAREYRKRMINTIAPYWKCGSGGDFPECVANVLGANHHQKADKENLKSHAKGEALKYDRNAVPNDFSVGIIMPFIDPNISQGKVKVTINRGPGLVLCLKNMRPALKTEVAKKRRRKRIEQQLHQRIKKSRHSKKKEGG
jgi:hypothetical protein